jgi:hypothetical protein
MVDKFSRRMFLEVSLWFGIVSAIGFNASSVSADEPVTQELLCEKTPENPRCIRKSELQKEISQMVEKRVKKLREKGMDVDTKAIEELIYAEYKRTLEPFFTLYDP